MFTACIRDVQFLREIISNNTIVNEAIQLALYDSNETTIEQCKTKNNEKN
jgi:hypothetical protein